ncbi:hypothetical protein JB92DRAFT_2839017 [Gautieria morchelliformis]|nr:hypothetical protein JB92DRAFT_2839017 [Gautieria morchelliformis]
MLDPPPALLLANPFAVLRGSPSPWQKFIHLRDRWMDRWMQLRSKIHRPTIPGVFSTGSFPQCQAGARRAWSLINRRTKNASITILVDRVVVARWGLGRASCVALHRLVPRFGLWAEMRRKEISQENKLGAAPEHHFIRADLGLFAEAKRVAHDTRTRADPRGIDHLVVSRSCRGSCLACCSRDSRYGHDFARRTPSSTFTHVQSSAVKTAFASNASLPWYLSLFLNVGIAVMGQTPASFAGVPFYLLVNPMGWVATSSVPFCDENADAIRIFRMRAQEQRFVIIRWKG